MSTTSIDWMLEEHNSECTLDNIIYRTSLIHAFLTHYEEYDDMSIDIISKILNSNYFYTEFLYSVEYISCLLREEVIRWYYKDFKDIMLDNSEVPQLLFKCYLKYNQLLVRDNNDSEDKLFDGIVKDLRGLTVSKVTKHVHWTDMQD